MTRAERPSLVGVLLRLIPAHARWPGTVVLFGAMPVLAVLLVFTTALEDDTVAMDFRQFYSGAERILEGESPYADPEGTLIGWGGPYPYPPLPALLAAPLTTLTLESAGLLVMLALVAAALGIPFVLGVRDWRLYGLALLWPPVLSAIQTGNLTLFLGLAAALAWRFRNQASVTATSVGVTLAAKFFLWPLVVWLAATRRLRSAALACVIGCGLFLISWSVLGFAGLLDYPSLLKRLEETVGADSYTLFIVLLDAGAPPGLARALWLVAGLALLVAVVVSSQRGNDRAAFVLAIAASLSLTPIVWLHYFALLLVIVAAAHPHIGVAWFVPFAMILTPGSGEPTPFETAWTLGAAALTVGLALRALSVDAVTRGFEPAVRSVAPGNRPTWR